MILNRTREGQLLNGDAKNAKPLTVKRAKEAKKKSGDK
jgi:hypothetical protein